MKRLKDSRKHGGFSLVQVIVALAVVAILAGMALPSFKAVAIKAKRAEGRSALYQLMLQEERFYSQRNKYIAFTSGSSGEEEKRFRWYSGDRPERSAYEFKAEACPGETIGECVRLVAMPGTGRVDANFKDPECGEFTLSSAGEKGANKPECWR